MSITPQVISDKAFLKNIQRLPIRKIISFLDKIYLNYITRYKDETELYIKN